METVIEFLQQYPQYELKYGIPVADQPRIYDEAELAGLPVELEPSYPARTGNGGRGKSRWNFNNTRTHYQCKTCERIKRHDFYFSGARFRKINSVSPHCKECAAQDFTDYYQDNKQVLVELRTDIWRYIAPKCLICGYDKHPVALDMHHLRDKEGTVSTLVTKLAQGFNVKAVGARLLSEAEKCIPLCSNCHRCLHAGVITLPDTLPTNRYTLTDLDKIVRDAKKKMKRPSNLSR